MARRRISEFLCDACGEMVVAQDSGTNPPKGWLVISAFSTAGEGGAAPAFGNGEFAFCPRCQKHKAALCEKLAALLQGLKK